MAAVFKDSLPKTNWFIEIRNVDKCSPDLTLTPNGFLPQHRASSTQQLDQPVTVEDLELLDHFLAGDAPEESMTLDELHGFLAAIICSPRMVMPSQWIPIVWGGTKPEFGTMDQTQYITNMMMRLNNDVSEKLSMADFDPLFMEEKLANGHVVLDPHGWCEGFVRGNAATA